MLCLDDKQQKFVVGDEYGTLSSFQIKKGEPQVSELPAQLAVSVVCRH